MKKRMLALVLAGVLSCNMGISVLAADEAPTGEENAVVSEITAEEETSDIVDDTEVPSDVLSEGEDVAEEPETEVPGTEVPETEEPEAEEPEDAVETQEPDADYTGWYDDEYGNRYYYVDGEMLTECIYEVDGKMYVFGWEGNMITDNWYTIWDNETEKLRYYCADSDGVLITGWHERYGEYYFFSLDEYYRYEDMIIEDGGNKYYLGKEGALVISSTVYYEGKLYDADENGVLSGERDAKDGWLNSGDDWYYIRDGKLIQNEFYTVAGKDYYFDYDGVMVTGSFEYYDEDAREWCWKLAETDGHIVKKNNIWYKFADEWYYFKADGKLASGELLTIAGKQYYFGVSGEMYTGVFSWYDNENQTTVWLVTDENGAIKTKIEKAGWVKNGDDWYYFKDAQTMANDEFVDIAGKRYYFDWNGIMQTGEIYYDGERYIADATGALVRNKWIQNEGNWYFASSDYTVYKNGVFTIDGKKYAFSNNGWMLTGVAYIYNDETDEGEYYIADSNGVILTGKGWKYVDLYYYYSDADGKLYTNQWIGNYYVTYDGTMAVGTYYIGDKPYYFDSNGYCRDDFSKEFKGWKLVDGYWYYHDANGQPVTGWVGEYYIRNGEMLTNTNVSFEDEKTGNYEQYYVGYDGKRIKNKWYLKPSYYYDGFEWIYADENGVLANDGWEKIDGKWYYFFDDGTIAANTSLYIEDKREFFDRNGVWINVKRNGWQFVNNGWYYYQKDGTLLEGVESAKIDGVTYYFWDYGRLKADCVETDDDTKVIYHYDSNGYRKTFKGWKQVGSTWYYADTNNKCAEGIKYIGGAYYYFESGHMITGNVYVDDPGWKGYYFFNASGKYVNVKNGWVSDGWNWYYFVNGKAVSDQVKTINGVTYAFWYNGEMATGRYHDFIFSNDGKLLRNAWYQNPYNKQWYYADASGRYVYGERKIGGKKYWFGDTGLMIK